MEGGHHEFTDALGSFDRLILLMRWGDGCTIDEMSRVLGCERADIERSLARLRDLAQAARASAGITQGAGSAAAPHG